MRRLPLLALLLLQGCLRTVSSAPDTGPGDLQRSPCPGYDLVPRRVGNNQPALKELSGLAASRRHPGIYWAHNDSGNPLELFALREDGSIAAQIPLTGASNVDLEDLALAPCGADSVESCLYLGDFGDNRQARSSVALYRLKEPQALENTPLAVEVLAFTYPDGAHNAESLVIDPRSAAAYVITKAAGTLGEVYRLDQLAPGATGTAVRVATVTAPHNADQVSTGASAHPSGERLLLRTYSHLWELRAPGAPSLAAVFDAAPVELPSPSQPQSEAVSYTSDGRGYLVGTEGDGEGLFRIDCRQ